MEFSILPPRAEPAALSAGNPAYRLAPHITSTQPLTARPVTAAETVAETRSGTARVVPLDTFEVGDNDRQPVPPEPPRTASVLAIIAILLQEPEEAETDAEPETVADPEATTEALPRAEAAAGFRAEPAAGRHVEPREGATRGSPPGNDDAGARPVPGDGPARTDPAGPERTLPDLLRSLSEAPADPLFDIRN